MKRLKAIIIDDEWLIRTELKTMLGQYSNIEIIGEAVNVNDAVKLWSELRPDLIFLDIHIPGGSGFEFLKQVKKDFKLVFITAFDQHRDEAQKYQAVDYLMKPISKEKLLKVIQSLG